MSLKIALIGCGKIADGHVDEVQKLPKIARVVAVCDSELLMAEQLAVRYQIPAFYDDFAKLVESEKPDVVHITTPPQSHLSLAKQALDAGCHIYVEKPLALSHADSIELVEAASRAGRKLTVGYTYLFDPPMQAVRKLYNEGVLGEIVHIDSMFGYNLGGAFGKAILSDSNHWVHRLPGKLFQNNIDHLIYKAVEFLDEDEMPEIHAFASTRRLERFGDARDIMQDELRVLINGKNISVSGVFSSHIRPTGHLLKIYGTKNSVKIDFNSRTVIFDKDTKLPGAFGRLALPFQQSHQFLQQGNQNIKRFLKYDFHFFAGLQNLIDMFYNSILNDTPVPISYKKILLVSAIMEEIFRQISEDGSIK